MAEYSKRHMKLYERIRKRMRDLGALRAARRPYLFLIDLVGLKFTAGSKEF